MKNTTLFCLLLFTITSLTLNAQHDSNTVNHPKISLKYAYRYRVKYGVHYKDSALYGYYFAKDTSYTQSFLKAYKDPLMALFMHDDKKAFRYIKKVRNINIVECIPKAITWIGYGAIIATGSATAFINPLIGLAAVGISCGVMGAGLALVAICEHAKKKSFIKGIKLYNRDYGYL